MTVSVETICGQRFMLASPAAPHLQIKAPSPLELVDIKVSGDFWLGDYLLNLVRHLALKNLHLSCSSTDDVTLEALFSAQSEKKRVAHKALEQAAHYGMLPFAWHGTTYFERQASRTDLGPFYDCDGIPRNAPF